MLSKPKIPYDQEELVVAYSEIMELLKDRLVEILVVLERLLKEYAEALPQYKKMETDKAAKEAGLSVEQFEKSPGYEDFCSLILVKLMSSYIPTIEEQCEIDEIYAWALATKALGMMDEDEKK